MAIQGIDVSTFQGVVDWARVKQAGIAFAYIKATEGMENDAKHAERQAYFLANWSEMRNAGILRGAYHFLRANEDSEAQAEAFAETVGVLEDDDLPPALDVETPDNTSKALIVLRAHRWLALVEQKLGVTPIVYTYARFGNENLDDTFGKYPLWIASYGEDAPTTPTVPLRTPALPSGWQDWTLWQYASKGTVDGVKSDVDLDLFDGALEDLQAFSDGSRR